MNISTLKSGVKVVQFWKEKNLLVAALDNRQINLWDINTLTQVCSFVGHKDEIRSLCIDPQGNYLYSGGKGTQEAAGLLIWDIRKPYQ